MIKLFRHIRQNLLSEGKTGKYIKYAIGEFILVVIGILIALSINNWNEDIKEDKLEISILKEIASNLEKDLLNIDEGIEVLTLYKNNTLKVYNHLKHKTPLTDSLLNAYSSLLGGRRFNGATMGYENLKSSGINIIKNDSLKSSIVELYNFYLLRLTNAQIVGEQVEEFAIKQRILKLKKQANILSF